MAVELNGAPPGGVPFDFEGRRLVLGRLDFAAELAAQKRVEANGYRRLQAHRDLLGLEEYERRLDRWVDRLATNAYAVGTPAFFQYLSSREGMKEFALLLFQSGQRDGGAAATPDLLDRLARDEARWGELVTLVTRLYFPFLLGPESPAPSTDGSSPSWPESPGAGTETPPSPVTAGG